MDMERPLQDARPQYDVMVFGGKWDAPVCQFATEVGTPIGSQCTHCSERIVEGDRGMLRAHWCMGDDNRLQHALRPVHRECDLRAVVGSIGHLLRACPCYGGVLDDPMGITPRQAALVVWAWVTVYGGVESG